jgi:hypothetical protein
MAKVEATLPFFVLYRVHPHSQSIAEKIIDLLRLAVPDHQNEGLGSVEGFETVED